MVALSLCCSPWAFFICSKQGLVLLWFAGFSWRWLLLLRNTHSRVYRLSCSVTWNLPGSGIEPMSSLSADRFLSTVSPGKSSTCITSKYQHYSCSGKGPIIRKKLSLLLWFFHSAIPKMTIHSTWNFDFSLYESKTAAL